MVDFSKEHCLRGYKLEKRIGKGGEAEVWKASSTETKNLVVAIKLREPILFTERDKFNEIKDRVDKETESWLKFKSLYVIHLHDRFTDIQKWEEQEYIISGIVTEYSEMGDLSKLLLRGLIRKHIKNELELVEFLLCIISGLESGHNNNLIHCDIKPSNILLFKEGSVLIPKLTDFGISRAFHEANIGGTKGYMAPELEALGASPSIQSDVYSLGITFYEIFYSCILENFNNTDLAANYESGESYKKYIDSLHSRSRSTTKWPIDKYKSIFSSMVKANQNDRISLAEVKRFLELNKGILLSQDYHRLIKKVNEKQYRWNPLVHKALNHNLYYVFVNGGVPNIDIDNLKRCLKEAHLFGYSLHTVSGAWNYILRLWADKSTAIQKLDKALKQYNQTVESPNNLTLEVVESHLFETSEFEADKDSSQVLNMLKLSINEKDRDSEFNYLKENNLVLSKFENEDDDYFRVFVLIAIKGIPDKLVYLIGDQLKELVKRHNGLKETSMYLIGNNENGIKILLKFKHNDFLMCREVLMSVYNEGQSYRDQDMSIRFNYQTFFHMDSPKDELSDDGDIIEKLAFLSR